MPPELPAVVAERFVRVGHLVGVFALLNSGTARLNSVQKLTCKALFHGVLVAGAGRFDQPADRQCFATLGAHFDRNLIGGTTNAARTHFDGRLDVVQRFVEDFDGRAFDFVFNTVHRVVNDTLRNRLLTVDHQVVHEFGENQITVLGVWQYFAFFSGVTT
ncbi:hypothetical protein NAS141_09641 [Sulfitobacter sp. NAS-14.1]|nr:hypothetical protein NAS141_09641 [Sulfitobacter sp. NAS-14.1]